MFRSRRCVVPAALVVGLLLPSVALACLWDYDTIKMERTRFPDTLELITGKFLRHSPEFYQWRIQNRLKRLDSDPNNLALLDDLAVAYDKTGQHDKAIETAQRAEKLRPGRYETAANLGTFYFHSGKLAEGLPHIERALTINPDAHFGREKYQKLLVEYVLKRRQGGPLKLPLSEVVVQPGQGNTPEPSDVKVQETFEQFLQPAGRRGLPEKESAAAIKGLSGMMKFGNHASPALLEALGTVLAPDLTLPKDDAKLLAARAYLKASYEVPEGLSRTDYRAMALRTLQMQTPRTSISQITLEQVEADFQTELADAKAWYADLREHELSWIRDGKDPEAEFDKLYDAEPEVPGMDVKDPMTPYERFVTIVGGVCLFVTVSMLVVGAAYLIRRCLTRRSAARARLQVRPHNE